MLRTEVVKISVGHILYLLKGPMVVDSWFYECQERAEAAGRHLQEALSVLRPTAEEPTS